MNAIEETQLAPGESMLRQIGDLIYITNGVLKEYDPRLRKRPAIINFMGAGDVFINRSHAVTQYLKAAIPTKLWIFRYATLWELHSRHPELLHVYRHLSAAYDSRLSYRAYILSHRSTQERIELFNDFFKPLLPYLGLRDIANYTAISYDHFIRHFTR